MWKFKKSSSLFNIKANIKCLFKKTTAPALDGVKVYREFTILGQRETIQYPTKRKLRNGSHNKHFQFLLSEPLTTA